MTFSQLSSSSSGRRLGGAASFLQFSFSKHLSGFFFVFCFLALSPSSGHVTEQVSFSQPMVFVVPSPQGQNFLLVIQSDNVLLLLLLVLRKEAFSSRSLLFSLDKMIFFVCLF